MIYHFKETHMKIVFVLAALACLFSLIYFGPDLREHFGTRYENANRKIFENNQSHVHGTIKNLTRLRYEYKTAEEGHKVALREMILLEAAEFGEARLPYELQSFINTLK